MLRVDRLSFQYGKNCILNNISFDVSNGTMLSVLAPNGAGKTTLIRCINSLLKPQSGSIFLDEERIDSMRPEKRARRIAYMPQRTEVSGLTVFDTVLLGRKPYTNWKPTAADLAKVEQVLQRLELTDQALRPLDQLSGGEMQKVSLARILVQEARLFLLDEPTGVLDLKNRVEILSLLRRFVHEHQLIAVLSIHDLNDALRFTDRLLFLKSGQVFADETPQTLVEHVVESVYGLPIELHNAGNHKIVVVRD